jgi:hypothetical protein
VDGVPLLPGEGTMVEGRFHYDPSTGDLDLWCPGGGDPVRHDVGIVRDDEYEMGFSVQAANDVTLVGLTVRFSGGNGISVLGDRVRIEKCNVRFNGKSGISIFGSGPLTSTGADIVGNDIYHNMLRNWPRGRYKACCWGMGAVSNGCPKTLFERNTVHKNGGEGLGAYGLPGGAVFRDNVVFDNWSVNMYPHAHALLENNFIYSDAPDPGDLRGNDDPDPSDNRNLRRLRPEGILLSDEEAPARLEDVTIRNNLIVNCRNGISMYHEDKAVGSALKEIHVLHNTIIVGHHKLPQEGMLVGLVIPYNEGNNRGSSYRNNIVMGTDPGTLLLDGRNMPEALKILGVDVPMASRGDAFLGLTIDHNLWFHSGREKPFHWGPSYRSSYDQTHAEWLALPGTAHGAGDVLADPRLVNAAGEKPADFELRDSSSPAVGAGAEAGVKEDFSHSARPAGSRPSIGAFEIRLAPGASPEPPRGKRGS